MIYHTCTKYIFFLNEIGKYTGRNTPLTVIQIIKCLTFGDLCNKNKITFLPMYNLYNVNHFWSDKQGIKSTGVSLQQGIVLTCNILINYFLLSFTPLSSKQVNNQDLAKSSKI